MELIRCIFEKLKLLGLLVLVGFSALGQSQFNNFRHISTSDGFLLNPVTSIAQDSRSLMWFGTRHGLLRYDGLRMKKVTLKSREESIIREDDILDFEILVNGQIWLAMADGLYIYHPELDSSQTFASYTNHEVGTLKNFITCIKQVASGDIWIGTRNGLSIYSPADGKLMEIEFPSQNNRSGANAINSIYQSKSGTIWVCTDDGLQKHIGISENRLQFKAYRNESGNINSLINDRVNTIIEDSIGNYWIGTRSGLEYFKTRLEIFEHFSKQTDRTLASEFIRTLAFDAEGRLWIGTFDGINVLDAKGNLTTARHDKTNPTSLSENKIRSLYVDNNSTVWVGSYYGGINSWSKKQLNFSKIDEANGDRLMSNVVSSIVQDQDGKIYFGTEGEGLSVYNPKSNKYEYINQVNKVDKLGIVKTLYFEDEDNLWIGTLHSGLVHYSLRTNQFKFYRHNESDTLGISSNSVLSIVKGEEGYLWVGTLNGGLNLLDKTTNTFTHIPLNVSDPFTPLAPTVRALYVVQGDLYVGTSNGLSILYKESIDQKNYQFHQLTGYETINHRQYVGSIYEDEQGQLWVGMLNLGLFKVVDEKLLSIELNEVSSVFSIVGTGNNELWMSTEDGILKYNTETKETELYDTRDGVPTNEFNNDAGLYSMEGWLYFGGASGVTVFRPDELGRSNVHAPDVILTDFKIFDESITARDHANILSKAIAYTDKLTLNYDQNIFTIQFALPNYIKTDKNVYYYRLAGLDNKWTKTTSTSASFTLQRGGTYVFEVRGENHDGVATDNIRSLTIELRNPPWRTWWAYLLYSAIVIIALYLLIKVYQSRIRLQHQLTIETRESLHQQEVNAQKLQFFTNISHEFRTPLTLIAGPLEQVIAEYKGSNKMFRQLLVIKRNADQLYKLINELMDFRKLENKQMKLQAAKGNIVRFVREIYLSFKQQADASNYGYTFESESETIDVFFDRDKLEKVLYNLISNAFKYTPAKGVIKVKIESTLTFVKISVIDTGDGISSDHVEKIFDRFYEVPDQKHYGKFKTGSGIGLAIAKSVVDLHHGNLEVESTFGVGSTFILTLPLGKSHLPEDNLIKEFKSSEDISQYVAPVALEVFENPKLVEYEEGEDEKKRLVLVVEDNPEVANFIHSVLRERYRIIIASNGRLGYQHAITDQPNLIISDVMMPEMDGIEFCGLVKSDINTSHIPFILLTARTSLIYKYNGLESGADEYMSKPFEVKELMLKCENIMNTHDRIKAKFIETGDFPPTDISVNSLDETMMKKAIHLVKENVANEFFNVQTFCEELGISRTLLFTKFKAWTNQTPNEYILSMRMSLAARLIEQDKHSISQIGYKVGFKDPNYFSKAFKKHFSISPKAYAEKFTDGI